MFRRSASSKSPLADDCIGSASIRLDPVKSGAIYRVQPGSKAFEAMTTIKRKTILHTPDSSLRNESIANDSGSLCRKKSIHDAFIEMCKASPMPSILAESADVGMRCVPLDQDDLRTLKLKPVRLESRLDAIAEDKGDNSDSLSDQKDDLYMSITKGKNPIEKLPQSPSCKENMCVKKIDFLHCNFEKTSKSDHENKNLYLQNDSRLSLCADSCKGMHEVDDQNQSINSINEKVKLSSTTIFENTALLKNCSEVDDFNTSNLAHKGIKKAKLNSENFIFRDPKINDKDHTSQKNQNFHIFLDSSIETKVNGTEEVVNSKDSKIIAKVGKAESSASTENLRLLSKSGQETSKSLISKKSLPSSTYMKTRSRATKMKDTLNESNTEDRIETIIENSSRSNLNIKQTSSSRMRSNILVKKKSNPVTVEKYLAPTLQQDDVKLDDGSAISVLRTKSGRASVSTLEWWRNQRLSVEKDANVNLQQGSIEKKLKKDKTTIPEKREHANKTNIQENDVWSKHQLELLHRAELKVDPLHKHFWSEVAKLVEGKSAAECQKKWFSSVEIYENKNKISRKRSSKLIENPEEADDMHGRAKVSKHKDKSRTAAIRNYLETQEAGRHNNFPDCAGEMEVNEKMRMAVKSIGDSIKTPEVAERSSKKSQKRRESSPQNYRIHPEGMGRNYIAALSKRMRGKPAAKPVLKSTEKGRKRGATVTESGRGFNLKANVSNKGIVKFHSQIDECTSSDNNQLFGGLSSESESSSF